jgi:LuxR family maltose regulon positive regulatory protein
MAKMVGNRAGAVRTAGRSRGAADPPPLAEAKLSAPRERPGTIDRPRILQALDRGKQAELVLVAAPTGYGKTTAVRAWCASRHGAYAWVTLDVLDNDPVRLWTYVATAIDRVRQGLGRLALQRLRMLDADLEGAIDELMNGIAAFGKELVLVLDDFHSIGGDDCLRSIDHALTRLPTNARLILLTRSDPSLGIARLRARSALVELRASELAFTRAETDELLVERTRIPLDADEIELLHRRTEGWAAALILAALWLRDVDDPGSAVREFGGAHRFMADYLTSEVLAALDDEDRSFLLHASVLRHVTAELCDTVLDRGDSASRLTGLERSNLLVLRLGRGDWYRIHPLFAQYAQAQLAAASPGAAVEIHRRAAGWFRARRLPAEACEHASAADDHELVAETLVEYHLSLVRSGQGRLLLTWVRTLPDRCLVEYPVLAVAAATAATQIGRLAVERRRYLRLADQARAERLESVGPYVEAVAEMVRAASIDGGVAAAVASGRRAVELAESAEDDVAVAALGSLARALYFAGELDEAWQAASRAVEHPQAEHRATGHAFARSTLALVALERGHLESARRQAETAREILGGVNSARSWLGANALAALGAVLAAEGDPAEAERALAQAAHYFHEEVADLHEVWLLALLARVRCQRGRLDEAGSALLAVRRMIGELLDAGRVVSLVAAVEAELDQARAQAARGEVGESPSKAELAVLSLLSTDLSAREIADALFLSPNTVRSHTRAIYRKLGVGSRADAVARAGVLGLLEQGDSPG